MRAGEKSLPPVEMTDFKESASGREDTLTNSPSIDRLLAHREMIFRICLGFSRNYAQAEDLTQETYLRACRNLPHLRNPLQAREWLIRIAKNACLDQKKKDHSRRMILRRWVRESESTEPAESTEDPDIMRRRLKTAVLRLPRKLKEVFILREYGHLTYDELAATLGLRKGTVMSRLNRARSRLAAELQEKDHDRRRK